MVDKIYVLKLYSATAENIEDYQDSVYHIYTDADVTSEDLDKIKDRIEKYKSENEDDWNYDHLCVEAEEYLRDNGYTVLEFGYNSISID